MNKSISFELENINLFENISYNKTKKNLQYEITVHDIPIFYVEVHVESYFFAQDYTNYFKDRNHFTLVSS